MKVYFVRDGEGDFSHNQYVGIHYKQTEKGDEDSKNQALQLVRKVKDVPLLDFYIYTSDTIISAQTLNSYTDVFFDNGRVVDVFEHLRSFDNLNPKNKIDSTCRKESEKLGYKSVKHNAPSTFLHTPKGERPKSANKVMPYLFASAGLSKLSRIPNYKFRKNIYTFLNGLTQRHSEDDVVLIFADNSVFKAMQKYPELHEFCYFGDEEVPFADGKGYDSKVKINSSAFHEMIIEEPAFVESRQKNMPVYEKYAVQKFIYGQNGASQKGE